MQKTRDTITAESVLGHLEACLSTAQARRAKDITYVTEKKKDY